MSKGSWGVPGDGSTVEGAGQELPIPRATFGDQRREERRGNVAVGSLPELELFHSRICVPPFGGLLGHRVAL